MYKLMIVDDEALARDVLKSIVLENFKEISIVCEATNGRQAVEYNAQFKPDIILMDIRIPGINGIEACKQILEHYKDVLILFVTAYDDFNFINQGLNLGILGYLLKPVKDEEVVEKINLCLNQLENKVNNKDEQQNIEKKVAVVKPLIEKYIVNELITGNNNEEIICYANFLQAKIEGGYFMLMATEDYNLNPINDALRNKINMTKLIDISAKFIPLIRKCLFGGTLGNMLIILFPIEGSDIHIEEISNEALLIAQNIKSKLSVMARVNIHIGIGGIYSGIDNIKYSYEEAKYALSSAVEKNDIIQYSKLEIRLDLDRIRYPIVLENEMLENVRIGDTAKAKELANDIFQYFTYKCIDIDLIKEYIMQLICMLNKTLMQMGVNHSLGNFKIMSELRQISLSDEIEVWYKYNVYSLIDSIVNLKQIGREKQVVNNIKEYINKCLLKDITLEKAAEEMGLGAAYISRLFKKEIGVNFIDYITGKRIELAKHMITAGEKDIKKISESLGYNDVNYFCRVFKKTTGVTTSQYRLQNFKIHG